MTTAAAPPSMSTELGVNQLQGRRVASVDIGSTSALLLIAERTSDGWRAVHEAAVVAKVSEGSDATGLLAEEAVQRAEAALLGFREQIARHDVDSAVATGTAPFRRAANGALVAERLSSALGFELEVVSGEVEALLSLDAVRVAFPAYESLRVIDPGGASTELTTVLEGDRVEALSMELGALRLAERFGLAGDAPLGADAVAALRRWLTAELNSSAAPEFAAAAGAPLVAIGGTATTLASLVLELAEWDAERVEGSALSSETLESLIARLSARSVSERARMPGMVPGRAALIPAGALLVEALLSYAGVSELQVSTRGIRWGRLNNWRP